MYCFTYPDCLERWSGQRCPDNRGSTVFTNPPFKWTGLKGWLELEGETTLGMQIHSSPSTIRLVAELERGHSTLTPKIRVQLFAVTLQNFVKSAQVDSDHHSKENHSSTTQRVLMWWIFTSSTFHKVTANRLSMYIHTGWQTQIFQTQIFQLY